MSKIHEIGRIYCLRSFKTDDIYIGSTFNPLHKRFHNHKRCYNAWKKENRNYITSFELIKYDDCYIELIEEHQNLNKKQLEKIEGEHQRKNECVNKNIAGRTKKEYQEEHKVDKKDYDKKYVEKTKDIKYQKFNCDICGGKYINCHRTTHLKTKKHITAQTSYFKDV